MKIHAALFRASKIAILSLFGGSAVMIVSHAVAYPRPGTTERISRHYDGSTVDGSSTHPKLSGDGRMVVFASTASKILPDDNNEQEDIFVHDRVTGETRFAAPIAEGRTTRWRTVEGTLSQDGRYVVFASLGRIFLGEHIGGIYITDLHTGVTELVSVRDDGTPSQNGQHLLNNVMTAISADNRYVVFMSTSNDLVPGFTPTFTGYNIYIRDRVAGRTELVSLDSTGAPASLQGQSPTISPDGRFVAWETRARLVPQDTSDAMKIYLRDRVAGTTELISVGSDGSLPNDDSWRPRISAGGTFVVFEGTASNLVPRDVAGIQSDVFVRNRLLGRTERISVTSAGEQITGMGYRASVSADGRHVAFWSDATNLVSGKPGIPDVYVRDLVTGRTELVSVALDGGFGNNGSQVPGISADGATVAWFGWASNLTADHDGTELQHVHLRERGPALGSYGVETNVQPQAVIVSGSAAFSGNVVSEASDAPGDAGSAGHDLGADLTGASLAWRPEDGEILIRWHVTNIPIVNVPDVTYGVGLTAGGKRYEVRAQGFGDPVTSPNGTFALYECEPVCVPIADLPGSYGTAGVEVQAVVPIALLPSPDSLTALEAYTGQLQGAGAAINTLDTITLSDAMLSTPLLRLGIAPAGTEPQQLGTVSLSDGRFATSLDTHLLAPGAYEVVISSCLGACVTNRYPFEILPPNPASIVSRKVHGTAGPFDISLPVTGDAGIECRAGGANNDYQLVLTFPRPVTFETASVNSGEIASASTSPNGLEVTVNLTGVSNAQTITLTLGGVTDGTTSNDVSAAMALLVGDTTADRFVNSADISQTKSQSGNTVTSSNFREDVNADGFLNSADISLVKSKSGTALP